MKEVRSAGTTSLVVTMAFLMALSFAAAPAAAEDETRTDSSGAVGELRGIRDELKAIAQTLGAVEKHQRVAALMTRIQLKQQRLASIEDELRSTRSEQEAAEQEIARLTGIEESWTKEKGEPFSNEGLSEEERRGLEIMRQQKKNLGSRVETLRPRIVELENDLAKARENILTLEETVDAQLGLR